MSAKTESQQWTAFFHRPDAFAIPTSHPRMFEFDCLRSIRCLIRWTFLLGYFSVAGSAVGQLPVIELTAIVPSVGRTDSTFPLRVVAGGHLEEVSQLLFSHPGISAELSTREPRLLEDHPSPQYGRFQVTVSPDVRPGVYDCRAVGRFGQSNPRPFLVCHSPVQVIDQEHSDRETATDLRLQGIVLDRCRPQQRNYYHIKLGAGQRMTIEGFASQLDSRAVVTLTLLDEQGHERQRSRTTGEFPAKVQYQAASDREGWLVVSDFLYQGGDDFYYALQINTTDADTAPSESAAMNSELSQLFQPSGGIDSVLVDRGLTFSGGHEDESILPVEQRSDPKSDHLLDVRLSGSRFFGERLSLPGDDGLYQVPLLVAGEFDSDNRQPVFDFNATAGQKLWLQVVSANEGQLTDPRVIVYKVTHDSSSEEATQQVLEQDDPAAIGNSAVRLKPLDPLLSFDVPETAHYRVKLLDNQTGKRPTGSKSFQFSVREPQPDYTLIGFRPTPINDAAQSKPTGSNLLRGGAESLQVLVVRRDGFNEAIEINVPELPAGVTCPAAIIPADSSETNLTIQCSEDAATWSGTIGLRGSSLGPLAIVSDAANATIQRSTTSTHNAIVTGLCHDLGLHVNANDVAPLAIALGDGKTITMARGGKLTFPIRLTRRVGGDASCVLRPQQLPPQCSLGEISIEADKNEAIAELQIGPETPPAEYTVWMQNETKVKFRQRPEAVPASESYIAKLESEMTALAQSTAQSETTSAAQNGQRNAELETALKSAREELESLKQSTTEREYNVFLPSSLQRIRVVATPFEISPIETVELSADQPVQVLLKISRQFGFAEAVDVTLDGDPPVDGLQFSAQPIAADADEVSIELGIPETASPTQVNLSIKLGYTFNGHNLFHTVSCPLTIR